MNLDEKINKIKEMVIEGWSLTYAMGSVKITEKVFYSKEFSNNPIIKELKDEQEKRRIAQLERKGISY